MGDYSYRRAGYNYKPQEKSMASWDNRNNGYETNSYGWGQTGFANGEGPYDHVCKPVIIDAQGRKKPLIACGPDNHTDGFFTKTETIIEQVHVPQVSTYANSSPTKGYGVLNNGWSTPVSPNYERPNRSNILGSTYWRQPPNFNSYEQPNGYGGNYEKGYNTWNKPNTNTLSDPYYQGRSHTSTDRQEPTMITSGGWARPNRVAWATPPHKEGALTRATNDIGTAVEYLQEATKPTFVNMASAPPFTIPTPVVPTLDSREARQRYGGGLSGTPQTVKTMETYSSTIDSREAARRYGGQAM